MCRASSLLSLPGDHEASTQRRDLDGDSSRPVKSASGFGGKLNCVPPIQTRDDRHVADMPRRLPR